MADLRTTFMGVELKNPIILGASSLVEDLNAIKKLNVPVLPRLYTAHSSKNRLTWNRFS